MQLFEPVREIVGIHGVVCQLGLIAHDRPLDTVERRHPVGGDTNGEHDRRSIDIGEQAGGALRQNRRIQRCTPIGQVHRDRSLERLDIEWVARSHERPDIGDCVVQDDVVAGDLDRKRLVEVDR